MRKSQLDAVSCLEILSGKKLYLWTYKLCFKTVSWVLLLFSNMEVRNFISRPGNPVNHQESDHILESDTEI